MVKLMEYTMGEGIRAFSTQRHGGVSVGAYSSFNANAFCGDNLEHVRKNRELLAAELCTDVSSIIVPHQTHSVNVHRVDAPCELEGVDALITDVPGLCLCVSTADCVPVLLYDSRHKAVAAIHAGWRGTVARIVQHTMSEMQKQFGTEAADTKAVIGPSISLQSFEVGDEVYDAFSREGFPMQQIARRYEKWHIDLWECNRLQLIDLGVEDKNIHVAGICTYRNVDDYFSARRLGIHSGRILNGIMIQ